MNRYTFEKTQGGVSMATAFNGEWVKYEEAQDEYRAAIDRIEDQERSHYERKMSQYYFAGFPRWMVAWVVGAFVAGFALGLFWVARCQ